MLKALLFLLVLLGHDRETLLFLFIFAVFVLLLPEGVLLIIRWCRKKIMGNPLLSLKTITPMARRNLQDDGTERSWDEESENFLTIHYPNWKKLDHTIMVPDIVQGGDPLTYPERNENAESKIFNLLKTFGNETQQQMFVVHSRNFCELVSFLENGIAKTEWIKGEHDFVIIHRQHGLIFLEVKGREKMKQVFKKGEEQIEKAKKAIESFLKKRFGKSKEFNRILYSFPGFVVMPNCPRPNQYHGSNGIFKEDCKDINSFKAWWEKAIVQPTKPEPFDSELYEELVKKLVPFVCSTPSLNLQINNTHKEILTLTPNQLKSWYKSCPEQWISGPAGSGKTVLLIEKVKQIAIDIIKGEHNQERILVLCCSIPLSVHINNEVSDWLNSNNFSSELCPVHVKTYDSFIDEIEGISIPVRPGQNNFFLECRLNIEKKFRSRPPPEEYMYEHIFVDEGQDMVGDQWPDVLKKLHRTPVAGRRYHYWIMYDSNQHLQRAEGNRSFLAKITSNTSQLTEVLRNTENIFSLSNKYYRGIYEGQITLGHKIIGLEVEYNANGQQRMQNSSAELVARCVEKLRESKVEDKDIAVLVRNIKGRDAFIKHLDKKFNIRCVTAENHLRQRDNSIALDTIKKFKGLESKVVVIFDPPCKPNRDAADRTREFLYTAVSRCFCYLIIFSTKNGCERIKNAILHVALDRQQSISSEDLARSSEDNEEQN